MPRDVQGIPLREEKREMNESSGEDDNPTRYELQ
jgi:hypothetical protein